MFQTKIVQKVKTHILCVCVCVRARERESFFLNLAFYEIMWKNFVERGSPQMTV